MRATITITLELDHHHVSTDPDEARDDLENALGQAARELGEIQSMLITVQGKRRRGFNREWK